jgi:serine/threonine-protein kinase
MLTGDQPHYGDSPALVLYKHLHEDVPPPSSLVPGLAFELDALVASATARNADIRPYDAVALLSQVLETRGSLDAEQLDAVPPQAITSEHDNAENLTSVIPRALSVPRPLPVNEDEPPVDERRLNRTSRLGAVGAPPAPAPPSRRAARERSRRTPLAVLVAVLLVLGVGAGVWYINSGQFTQVPSVLSQTQAEAENRLKGAGLEFKIERAYSDTKARGTVIRTDPEIGERIRDNDTVTLTISKGPETVPVPQVTGQRLDKARALLKRTGLEPGMVTREFSEEVPRGSVISTSPVSGTERRAGSAVALVVSKGSPVEVSDVTGADLADAQAELEEAGLKVKVATRTVNSDEFEQGQVAVQSPEGGSEAEQGDTITLTISKGPEMIEVPDVVGDSVDDAKAALEGAGFAVEEDRGLLGLFGDTVKKQSVDGGDTAAKGSTITITIR